MGHLAEHIDLRPCHIPTATNYAANAPRWNRGEKSAQRSAGRTGAQACCTPCRADSVNQAGLPAPGDRMALSGDFLFAPIIDDMKPSDGIVTFAEMKAELGCE